MRFETTSVFQNVKQEFSKDNKFLLYFTCDNMLHIKCIECISNTKEKHGNSGKYYRKVTEKSMLPVPMTYR